jgi:hypothetical protein
MLCAFVQQGMATHLRAGQIVVEHLGPRTVKIRIEVWTNTLNTSVLFGGDQDILDFGDGNTLLVSPEITGSTSGPNGQLPDNVNYAYYEVIHEYGAPGFYTISYREPNRNEHINNMTISGNEMFYIETRILIDPAIGTNNSPRLMIDPIDRSCAGVAFFHNPGAFDPDTEDSLSYEMVIPFSARNTPVAGYKLPNEPEFYGGTNYQTASETGGPPTFSINAVTGDLRWDAPWKLGEYNIAFNVVEHRKINGVWRRIGFVRRDMQILVEDCENERPTLELPPDTCVVAKTLLEADIIGKDVDGDPVKIEAFSQIMNAPFNPVATITPDPGINDFVPVDATTKFRWQTECEHIRQQPYSVVFKISDKPPLGPSLATFDTWFITVVGPKPVWNNYVKNPERSVTLNWSDYLCGNAVAMQVWRKVDGSDFQPSNCETGMPSYLGYEMIGLVDLTTGNVTSFTDNNNNEGLEAGPTYCYRLVAVFPPGTRAESLVSDDLCVEPFELTDPVITHVDVDVTDEVNGKIIVRWIEPKENPTYPPGTAFTYKVYRGTGFAGAPAATPIATTTDLFFEDTGLDTESLIYNYVVEAYAGAPEALVGKTSQASSVRVETQSRNKRIDLSWTADVPWSNNISGLTHRIYRGDEGSDSKDDLVFLTEVNVNQEGFSYVDLGPLENRFYCYLVETYGSYGNDEIHTDALINRSQINCTKPGDEEPPCKPQPPQPEEPQDCLTQVFDDEYECGGGKVYENHLKWAKEECADDIAAYIIYYSNSETGDYVPLDTVRNVFEYIDNDDALLNTRARCYRISALDRSGNEGEKSEPFCFDNCPYYELPNVFTPNDDQCNDLFQAYNNKFAPGPKCEFPEVSKERCARFVQNVTFHVYNRWGRQVYSYSSTDARSGDSALDPILINWDGRSDEGQELSTGVYYYIAEVTFNTIRESSKYKTLKGWVRIIREADQQ